MIIWLEEFCTKYPYTIKAFGALAPAFIAFMMFFVAFKQWETSERQRRKELFDMRYELLGSITFFFDSQWIAIKKQIFNYETYHELVEQNIQKLYKYQFLIKHKDVTCLIKYIMECRDNICNYWEQNKKNREFSINDYMRKNEDYLGQINKILEPYLRIEPEETIWAILKRWGISTYEFLTPKWLQKFISEQSKTRCHSELNSAVER